MEEYIKAASHILQQTATIHIYSFPHFLLEIFLACLFLMIYGILHLQVTTIYKSMVKLKPNAIYCASYTGSLSKDSICSVTTHYQKIYRVGKPRSASMVSYKRLAKNVSTNSQMGWVLPKKPNANRAVEKERYADQLIALTPRQFVKLDKERKLREKEMDSYMTSLSTLCKNILKKKFSSGTLRRQVETARENLQCNQVMSEGKYLRSKTDTMTRSLFIMLEQMITSTSLQTPLPFKGDITALALDIADLSAEPQYNYTKNIGTWETSSSIATSQECLQSTITVNGEPNWDSDNSTNLQWDDLR